MSKNDGHKSAAERTYLVTASLLQPEGCTRAVILGAEESSLFFKDYNFSDLYVLFVGTSGGARLRWAALETPWSRMPAQTTDVELMQGGGHAGPLQGRGRGRAGVDKRAALGAYQKKNGLDEVELFAHRATMLEHMRR